MLNLATKTKAFPRFVKLSKFGNLVEFKLKYAIIKIWKNKSH